MEVLFFKEKYPVLGIHIQCFDNPKLNTEHDGYAWVSFGHWPKPLHQGLRKTIQNKMNQLKLDTVFKMLKLMQ